MAEPQIVIRHIAWREVFPWLHLTSALRQAVRTRFLVMSALAVLATVCGWWLIGSLFSGSESQPLKSWVEAYAQCPWSEPTIAEGVPMPGALLPPSDLLPSPLVLQPPEMASRAASPYDLAWLNLSAPLRQIFDRQTSLVSLAFLLLQALWALLVWSYFGLAMTRIAAVQLCREESISWSAAFRYARGKFISAFAAPVLPLLGLLMLVLPVLLLSLLLRADGSAYVAAVLWPIALVAGLMITIIVVGLLFGWPLMTPAISTEGSDSFDAISRAYSYVYQRPLHYAWYTFLAILLGILGAAVVNGFAEGVLYLTNWAASWGSGNARSPSELMAHRFDPDGSGAGRVLMFWTGFVRLAAVAFVYSYFWSAATQIYLLLRYDTDGTELDEVFLEDDDPRGLPSLATDAAGVPVVAEEDAVAEPGQSSEG